MRRTRFTRFCARSCALIAWLAVGACSSVPTHFYTLMHPAGPGAPAPAPFAIAVLPVGIPAQADQPQLVVRTGTGSVAVLDNERWVAPLADEIRAALADDLERSLGARDVRGQAHREGQAVYRVQLDVRRLDRKSVV